MNEQEKSLKEGLRGRQETSVSEENTASAMKSGTLGVFATPAMLALMEETAEKSVREFIDDGFVTVGISADIKHLAPSPTGMKIYCESVLVKAEGRILTFELSVYDEREKIGEGTHKRCIVNAEKFLSGAYNKK